MVEMGLKKGDSRKDWAMLRIVGLVALAVCVPLLVASAARQREETYTPIVAPVLAQAGATGTPTVFIPGMPVLCVPSTTPPTLEVQPTSTPLPTTPAFGLAWFHKPPDGSSAKTVAAEHRYIHLTGPSDIPFMEELRAAGFKGPIYTYVTAYAVEGPGPYRDASAACDANYTPYDNNVAWEKGDFCKYIHPNEAWFLHNGKGERLVEDYFGTQRYTYVMNPSHPGWRDFSYSRLVYARDHWGYDGLWLDNLDLDLGRTTREAKNSDGRVREFASDNAWRDAMAGWLAGLRERLGDWPVWANMVGGQLGPGAWDAYAPYLDGAMDESFAVRWLDGWRTDGEWLAQMDRAEQWIQSGKGLVMVGQGARDDKERLLYTLASYMLVANGSSSFRYTRFDSYYDALWLYPEYETALALGAPTGQRTEVSRGVWRREFVGGYVEVDSNTHSGRLALEPGN
ncbi:MAG TPA: putative glycoside hydrolase [Chloroflexia bacterium]|nr:putative glycoside hydrolase [Chloroflexia bacterium]